MLSLCRTLLGFAGHDDRGRSVQRRRACGAALSGAAGLRCVAAEIPAPPAHVVESAAVGPRVSLSSVLSPPPRPPPLLKEAVEEEKKAAVEWIDDGTRGLGYLYGRDGGGRLELCTESLGFESCCDGRMGEEEERAEQEIRRRIEEASRSYPVGQQGGGATRRKAKPARSRTEKKEFPPPLTWMSGGGGGGGGRFRSFLKAVRTDGRFLLKEVQIERPEVFHASRHCGRLRLELVNREPEAEDGGEESAEPEEAVSETAPWTELEPAEAEEEEQVEEEVRWLLPATISLERSTEAAAGFRSGRCQELAREGLPSSPFWGTRFLTTA